MATDDDDEAMRVIRTTMAMTMTKTMVRITIWQRGKWWPNQALDV